jgi:hypothetical protein
MKSDEFAFRDLEVLINIFMKNQSIHETWVTDFSP